MIAAIPYTTFPEIELGPLTLRVFGLMVAAGVLIGARLGGGYGERFGVLREDSYRTGTLMVLAGIIGARLTWVATHTDQIDKPIDVIAIWEGGIQFSGGFIAALIVGYPMFRKWTRVQRWNVLNGYAWGLTIGMALGRVGCYAVGEHFGGQSDFFLASRYDGGSVREPELGDTLLTKGMTFHNTALYELITLGLLFLVMTAMIGWARRKDTYPKPATLVALFMVWAGGVRFLLDTLRVNDERALGMTGAQWMSLVMVPYGIYLWVKVRPAVSKLVGADGLPLEAPATDEGSLLAATEDSDAETDDTPVPDEVAPPEEPSAAADEAEADADADEETESEPEPVADADTEEADTEEAEPEPVAESDEVEAVEDAEPEPVAESDEVVEAEAEEIEPDDAEESEAAEADVPSNGAAEDDDESEPAEAEKA
ncbi:MAG TPA: prolipoprotein diacylglyceryl transferase family protein [Acidimicrobiales bacterium]|nr:prolipoprotein diacylglyceryl transferase family protein [Acidimicrobiales bacterium]